MTNQFQVGDKIRIENDPTEYRVGRCGKEFVTIENFEGIDFYREYVLNPKTMSAIAYREGKDLTAIKKGLVRDCRSKLDRYAVPRKIIFTDAIPRTDNGKIKRNALKEIYG